jgi:hypothetical protein
MERSALNLPSKIKFDDCPVHFSSEKIVLALNDKDYSVSFEFKAQLPFSIHPFEGELAAGQSVQLHVMFSPQVYYLFFILR